MKAINGLEYLAEEAVSYHFRERPLRLVLDEVKQVSAGTVLQSDICRALLVARDRQGLFVGRYLLDRFLVPGLRVSRTVVELSRRHLIALAGVTVKAALGGRIRAAEGHTFVVETHCYRGSALYVRVLGKRFFQLSK
jgi:hypothetical protein